MGDVFNALGSGISNLFGGGGSSQTGGNAAINPAGNTGGNPLSSIASALSDALVSPAQADQPQIDPVTGASLAINPPNADLSQAASSVGGTQSGGAPTSAQGPQNQQPQGGQQYAPDSAVSSLAKALKTLSGQGQNPYQPPPPQQPMPIPSMTGTGKPSWWIAPGETPKDVLEAQTAVPQGGPTLPDVSVGETGRQAQPGVLPSPVVDPTIAAGGPGAGAAQAPAPQGDPGAAGSSAVGDPAEARTPPPGQEAPSTTGGQPTPKTDDQGRPIVVKKRGAGAQPVTTPPGTADESVPTKKDQPQPQAARPQPGPIMRDITGGQSIPPILPELALAALSMLPMLMGGGGRRFHQRPPGFFHHGGRGHWPYFHPGMGWQFHGFHPGHPWMPMHPRHMGALGFGPGGGPEDPFSSILQSLIGARDQGNQMAGGGQQGGGQPRGGQGYVKSGNEFTDTLTGAESPNGNVISESDKDSRGRTLAQGGDPNEISSGFFQIQNYRRGGTWGHYSAIAGVNAPTPMDASYEDQHKVARLIPVREWGSRTRKILHDKFGTFNENMTLGQLEDWRASLAGGGGKTASAGGGGEPLIKSRPLGDLASGYGASPIQ